MTFSPGLMSMVLSGKTTTFSQQNITGKESHNMYAVIRENRDRSITRLLNCQSLEAAIVASQAEKSKVPIQERSAIRAVALDDGGYTEIVL